MRLAILSCLVLAACTVPADTERETTVSAMTVGAAPAADFRGALNAERGAAGLPPLAPAAGLQRAADRHLADMVASGTFSHRGSDGSDLGRRFRESGWCLNNGGENIARGQDTPAAVIQSWMASTGHRANILKRGATGYGVARAGETWVLVVGGPC